MPEKVSCNICMGEDKYCLKCNGKGYVKACNKCGKEGRVGSIRNKDGLWENYCYNCGHQEEIVREESI